MREKNPSLVSSVLLSDPQVLMKILTVSGENGPAFLIIFALFFSLKGSLDLGHRRKGMTQESVLNTSELKYRRYKSTFPCSHPIFPMVGQYGEKKDFFLVIYN